jgi:hypothetical protein
MNNFEPWARYPDLTRDRLSAVAGIIRDVRRDAVQLHDTANGDNEWSLGCRVYVRTCHAIRKAAKDHPWLTILPEAEVLRFSFAIESVPFRFYKGASDDPPERYLIATYGELHHRQMSFEMEGLPPLDTTLRLAVEVDPATRLVSSVIFVEMDESGNITQTYAIPFDLEPDRVTPMQAKPIDLPPPILEPLKTAERNKQEKQEKRREAEKTR